MNFRLESQNKLKRDIHVWISNLNGTLNATPAQNLNLMRPFRTQECNCCCFGGKIVGSLLKWKSKVMTKKLPDCKDLDLLHLNFIEGVKETINNLLWIFGKNVKICT